MKAVVFARHGDPAEVLEVRDVPVPQPRRGEVRVRMVASPVNPSDLLFVEGRYGLKRELPATPGFEGVGVVEASGGGVLGWLRRGKRVCVINDRTGDWQEYAVVPARQVVPVPADVPDDQAAAFFVNPATALVMTRYVLRVPPGAWLLQSAAGGALGRMVIRLGKLYGFRTLNVVRRPEQAEELKRLGADAVISGPEESIPERVREVTGGAGVRYAIDPVGGATGSAVVASLAAGGRALLYGLLSGQPVTLDPRRMISVSTRVEGFWLSDWTQRQGVLTLLRLFRRVGRLMRGGTLTTEVGATYPLDQVREAVRHAARPGRGGKVMLRIGGR